MAFTYSFVDNEIYGTDDINDITKCLTGAGVAPFVSKDSYSVSDLNVLTAEEVTSGTSMDGCKCTAENTGTAEMMVTVSQGIVFFESGVRLVIDAEGYSFSVTPNVYGFVFAYFSPTLQKADIIFDTDLPTAGEYVILAELTADGKLTDKRSYARSKIATMGRNVLLTASFTPMEKTFIHEDGDTRCFAVANVSGVNLSNFNYAFIGSGDFSAANGVPYGCFFDLNKEQGIFSLSGSNNLPSNGDVFMTARNYSLWYGVEIFNNELCIVAKCSIMNGGERYINTSSFSNYTATFM